MLSETEKAVIETMRLKLSTNHSLQYLKDNELPLSRASYFRHKKKLEEKKLQRLYEIVRIGFEDQHLETIDELEMSFKILWANVLRERDPYKQNQMIKDIIMLKPYLSAYYEATKYIVEKQQPIIIEGKKDNKNKSEKQQHEPEDDEEEELNRNINDKPKIKEYDPNRKF